MLVFPESLNVYHGKARESDEAARISTNVSAAATTAADTAAAAAAATVTAVVRCT
jgi:hypothetical protein